MKTKRLTTLSLLTAVSLILFLVELRMPDIAIPGVKLGLANIVTVYAVFRYTAKETAMLVAVRLLLGCIFAGNPSALLYSAAGACLCLIGMLCVRRFLDASHIWLCSVLGGMLHNVGQLLMAVMILRSVTIAASAPVLLIAGAVAGLLTGLCAQYLVNHAEKKNE